MRRALFACVVGVAIVTTATSCSSDDKGSSDGSVAVEARENGKVYSLVADKTSVPAGSVTFHLSNRGTIQHEMVVLKTDEPIDGLTVGADKKVSEDASVGEVGEINAGASGTVTIDLKPGKYVLVCNIALHYGLGMRTAFTVTG